MYSSIIGTYFYNNLYLHDIEITQFTRDEYSSSPMSLLSLYINTEQDSLSKYKQKKCMYIFVYLHILTYTHIYIFCIKTSEFFKELIK